MPATKKQLFAQITKINVAKRQVAGILMQEVVDLSNEKCLYEESKPHFKAWSEAQNKASGGKSKGNLRAMHTTKVAGRVVDLVCDDEQKAFVITAEVDADDEWKLVLKGAYTGFSVGANFGRDANNKIIKTAEDDGSMGWVAVPIEASLVDLPCVPTAVFSIVEEDGSEKLCKFHSPETEKSMYSVSRMADILSSLSYMLADLEWEQTYEDDDSVVPARLRTWLEDGAVIFGDLATEETSEFVAQFTAAKAARAEVTKAAGCNCGCAACADCTTKKKALPEPENEKDNMTPEQIKAALGESLKGIFASEEYKTQQVESVKLAITSDAGKGAIAEVVKAELPAQVKAAVEDALKNSESVKFFDQLMEQIGDEPAPSKVAHASATITTRENDKGAGEGAVTELTQEEWNDRSPAGQAKRVKAITAMRKSQEASGEAHNGRVGVA